MRIELNNGEWMDGQAVLTTTPCACPTCTCVPFWDIQIRHYSSDGKMMSYTCFGSRKDTEEESIKELVKALDFRKSYKR